MATLVANPSISASPAEATPTSNITGQQWHQDALNFEEIHEISTGEGITIGLVDSGVDVTHPDLEDADISGRGFGGAQADGLGDTHGHGTEMASLLVGQGVGTDGEEGVLGIAPDASLLTASLPSTDHISRLDPYDQWVDDAVRWLVDEGADVINLSIGQPPSPEVHEYARQNEVVMVYAAGNVIEDEWGNTPDRNAQGPPGSITVNAGDRNGNPADIAAYFHSNQFGFTAPGVDIPLARPGGEYVLAEHGSSMASPLTAGMWALVMSAYPDLTEEQLFDRVIWEKYPGTEPGELPDERAGYGSIDPLLALTQEIEGHEMTGPPEPENDETPEVEEEEAETSAEPTDGVQEEDDSPTEAETPAANPAPASTEGNRPSTPLLISTAAGVILLLPLGVVLLLRRRQRGPRVSDLPK